MKTAIGACALLLASAVLAAETYRWVDERGVTNYGQKPPAGRPSTVVTMPPPGTVDTEVAPAKRPEPELRRAPAAQPPPSAVPVAPAPVASAPARGMDFQTFIHLRNGMTEGELMLRAGAPDFQSVENLVDDIAKSYYYYPTLANPFITVVIVRGGRIVNIERNRKTF